MSKKERISVNKFESVLNKENNMVEMDICGISVAITKTISLKDVITFVGNVVDSCVDVESGQYLPELYDFTIRREVLTTYANFNMPSNVNYMYELLYQTPFYSSVVEIIDKEQFALIKNMIDKKIKYELDAMTSIAAKKAYEIAQQIEGFGEKATDFLNDTNTSDLQNVITTLLGMGDLDEEKLAHAVLNKDVTSDKKEVETSNEETEINPNLVIVDKVIDEQ